MEDENRGIDLPDWYRIERESEKTIGMIRDLSELEFYLEDPDPFIRRLAIIRAGVLGSREVFSVLGKVVEDPLESDRNRGLAGAWMQKISEELGLGYYARNCYSQKVRAGTPAPPAQSFPVFDSQPAVRYTFSKSLIESQLHMDQSLLRINLDNREFFFHYRIGKWLASLCGSFARRTIVSARKAFVRIFAVLPVLARTIFLSIPRYLAKSISACRARFVRSDRNQRPIKNREGTVGESVEERTAEVQASGNLDEALKPRERIYEEPRFKRMAPVRYKKSRPRRIPFFINGGMVFRQLLLILTAPLRFALRHKAVIIGSIITIYLLISLTIPGKALLKSLSPRFYEENERFVQNVGRHTAEALQGRLFTETPVSELSATPVYIEQVTRYAVTAPKGLYLRDMPAYESGKIILMKMSTIVEYLDEKSVAQDIVWLKIRLADGTSGWANAKWLKEISDG